MIKQFLNLKISENRLYYLLVTLFFAWMCLGIFPLVCYEDDSLTVIKGCDIAYNSGWELARTYCYEYRMQPLSVNLLLLIKHIVPVFTCEQIYCMMSALFSFAFFIGCTVFVRLITGENRFKILLAALLLPETYAIAMYANTAVPAAASLVWALVLIIKERKRWAALLLGIAPMFRLDVLMVYPAILPLFMFLGNNFKKSLTLSAIYAAVVLTIGGLGFWLFQADFISAFHGYERWNVLVPRLHVLLGLTGYYLFIYMLLMPIGIYYIWRKKWYKELFLVLLPIALLHFCYRSMGCAAKHYLYITPFVLIVGLRSFGWFKEVVFTHKYLKYATISALCIFEVISVSVVTSSRPWQTETIAYTAARVVKAGPIRLLNNDFYVGIGAGQYVPTMDELMLATGNLFYSWYIHENKMPIVESRETLTQAIDQIPEAHIFTIGWNSSAFLSSYYLNQGYAFSRPDDQYFELSKNGHTLRMYNTSGAEEEADVRTALLDFANNIHPDGDFYVVVKSPRLKYFFTHNFACESIEKITDNLYKIKHPLW